MALRNIGNENLKIGDLVMLDEHTADNFDRINEVALILEIGIDMWGEEMIPDGVRVLWPDGKTEVVYSDEVFSVNREKS